MFEFWQAPCIQWPGSNTIITLEQIYSNEIKKEGLEINGENVWSADLNYGKQFAFKFLKLI